jgi:uncharacterized protein (DUF1697 family)
VAVVHRDVLSSGPRYGATVTRLFGFLRAVNVGGRTIKMAELRRIVASVGYADVETFIASGNVVVTSENRASQVEAAIEKALQDELGLQVETFVRTAAELAAIAAAEPFGAVEGGHTVQVGLIRSPLASAAQRAVVELATDYDELLVDRREIYWLTRGGVSGSLIKPTRFAKALGVPVTFRNLTTVHRLVQKYAGC